MSLTLVRCQWVPVAHSLLRHNPGIGFENHPTTWVTGVFSFRCMFRVMFRFGVEHTA
jgi:hypothetical protein